MKWAVSNLRGPLVFVKRGPWVFQGRGDALLPKEASRCKEGISPQYDVNPEDDKAKKAEEPGPLK